MPTLNVYLQAHKVGVLNIERFHESVFNEYFCMKLAKACGLHVAECDILEIQDIPYYVVERYDRQSVIYPGR